MVEGADRRQPGKPAALAHRGLLAVPILRVTCSGECSACPECRPARGAEARSWPPPYAWPRWWVT